MPKDKYFAVSLAASAASAAAAAVALYTIPLEMELALNWIQLACLFAAFLCAIDFTKKDKANLFFQLQTGAIMCFTAGQIYWVLHLLIIGYDDRTFSISDLSWIGFYLFLFSAVFGSLNHSVKKDNRKYIKYRIAAIAAPAVFAASGIIQLLCVIHNGIRDIFYVAVYSSIMVPLSYYAMKLLIIPSGNNKMVKAMRPYNALILIFMSVDTVWTFSDLLDLQILFLICEFLLCILLLMIPPAAYRGYSK